MTNREYLVALYSFIPFGPARTKLLTSYFGDAKKVWTAKKKDLVKVGISEKTADDFGYHRDNFEAEDYFTKLKREGIHFVTLNDPDYSENLLGLPDAPPVLYLKGEIKANDTNSIAIVGSRKMTSYGKEVTEKFATELASLGVTIVSGLARGVDTVAHSAAMSVGGRTLAVLGCGLDMVYPPENTHLAKRIIENGALISEYPLGYPAFRINFATRNRIISGLSRAIIVIEGQEKSGTLLTASHAAEQGRTVFAVPGQITSPNSAAPFFLIKNGAKMVTEVKDILEELNFQLTVDREAVEKVMPSTKYEEDLIKILANEPFHLDEIARILGLSVATISARLTIMELKGLVKNIGGGVYKKV